MKNKSFTLGLLTSALLLGAGTASASLLLYEGFDYSMGSLVPENGGLGFTSAWQNSGAGGDTVAYPGLTYSSGTSHLVTVGGYTSITSSGTAGSFRTFTPVVAAANATTTLWMSFIGNTAGSPYGTSGDEAAIQLRNAAQTDLISIGAFGSSANWRVRVKNTSGGGTLFSDAAGSVSSLSQAFIVMRVDVNTAAAGMDAVHFWVNPVLGEELLLSNATGSISGVDLWGGTDFSLSVIRSGVINSGTAESKTLTYDEFRLGTTLESVTPVPEAGSVALFLAAGVAGLLFLRRRR